MCKSNFCDKFFKISRAPSGLGVVRARHSHAIPPHADPRRVPADASARTGVKSKLNTPEDATGLEPEIRRNSGSRAPEFAPLPRAPATESLLPQPCPARRSAAAPWRRRRRLCARCTCTATRSATSPHTPRSATSSLRRCVRTWERERRGNAQSTRLLQTCLPLFFWCWCGLERASGLRERTFCAHTWQPNTRERECQALTAGFSRIYILAHTCNLYTFARTTLAWYHVQSAKLRKRFDDKAALSDPVAIEQALSAGEAEFRAKRHPDPYVTPFMFGGSRYMRNPPLPEGFHAHLDYAREH